MKLIIFLTVFVTLSKSLRGNESSEVVKLIAEDFKKYDLVYAHFDNANLVILHNAKSRDVAIINNPSLGERKFSLKLNYKPVKVINHTKLVRLPPQRDDEELGKAIGYHFINRLDDSIEITFNRVGSKNQPMTTFRITLEWGEELRLHSKPFGAHDERFKKVLLK